MQSMHTCGPSTSSLAVILLLQTSAALSPSQRHRLPLRPIASRSLRSGCSPVACSPSGEGVDVGERLRGYWDNTTAFIGAFKVPKLEEDALPEAVALQAHLSEVQDDPSKGDIALLTNLTNTYYGASFQRIFQNPAVADRLPEAFSLLNGALVLVVLRLLLPRLLAIQSMQDLYELAPELGLPSRDELLGYVRYAEQVVATGSAPAAHPLCTRAVTPLCAQMDFATKLGLFLLVIVIEKVSLAGEFLPFGVVLPAISPVLFGGVLQAHPPAQSRSDLPPHLARIAACPGDGHLGGVRLRRLLRQLHGGARLPA